jgi:serine/threonine protein kinase
MKKIGRYDIISELGRGAMGVVYRASDPTIGREVALKVLTLAASPGEGTNSPQEMFMREIRAAGRLTHPSIVAIHDAFDDSENQTSCIVMEMVPGVTLEKILESDPPPTVEEALDIVRQVAEGLDYAHRNQVIHRDLKPANILVTMDGRAKITDFGIAKVLAREGIARTVGVMGTPSYMSPEQVKGGEIDARSDLFSLGIIVYTMFAGKKPFSGNTAAVMFKIVYEEPPAPSSLNAKLTPGHDFVVKKCLAKDRNQRYSSARELVGDIEDLQHGRFPRSQAGAPTGASATPPTPAAPTRAERPPAPPAPSVAKPAPPPPTPRPAPPPAPPTQQNVAPPKPAAPPPKPPSPPSPNGTLVMTRPSFLDESPQPSPRVAPPPPPAPPPPKPLSPPTPGGTLVMTRPSFLDESPQPPSRVTPPPPPVPVPLAKPVVPPPVAQPLPGQTLSMQVPDLSSLKPSTPPPPPAAPRPPVTGGSAMKRQKPPMAVPPAPPKAPGPSAPPSSSMMEPPAPMPASQLSGVFPAVGGQPTTLPPPPPPSPEFAVAPEGVPDAVVPAPKSKLLPVALAGVAVILLAGAALVYWGIRRERAAAPPPAQVAVQTPPVAPPVTTPAETPTPPPDATATATTPPVTGAPTVGVPATGATGVPKKPVIRKPKPAATPAPAEPAPEPAPVQPAPVATPAPQPAPPTPSPEDIAKAEAARLAKIPRIINVLCNYGMKEATFVFSTGGKALFEETLKGKKIKGGFLGIKGSYQGTFTHTITVPAGVQEVSVRVLAKDGATDLTKAIKMPPPGGFVPTLAVDVDNEHLALDWKSSAAAK